MNISPKTVASLSQQGWDILRVSQSLPVNASDQEILDLARQEERVIEILPQLEDALGKGSAVTIEDASVRIRRLPSSEMDRN